MLSLFTFLNLFLGGDGRGPPEHIFSSFLNTERAHDCFLGFQKLLLKRSAVSFKPVLPIEERRHTCILLQRITIITTTTIYSDS